MPKKNCILNLPGYSIKKVGGENPVKRLSQTRAWYRVERRQSFIKAHERSVENALIIHVRDFLIELGQGFAFVGSQVLLTFDDQLRKPGNNQTIGILLCKSKNKVMAEYALRNISAPIGVSEYTLSKSIPTDLKGSLLTIEEIEAELNESVKED